MDQNTNRTTLKIFGVIMLLFGLVYGIVGSLALLGLAGVIYNQIALDSFNLFDMLGLLFGVSIAATAMKLRK